MDRVWLLTWTTYGTWLPGDERGHVSNVRSSDGTGRRHNTPGSEPEAKQRGLVIMARTKLVGDPIFLGQELAEPIMKQFHETAAYRGWTLLAVGIMSNHIHVVVGVPGDPEPEDVLRDFKSYASRCLNRLRGKPASGTWWTEGGSKRKKEGREVILAAIEYVRNQEFPLLIWVNEEFLRSIGERGA
jgi:REP element-mobilizing transposase RayT